MKAWVWTSLALTGLVALTPVAGAINQACLQSAANDRGTAMRDAYDTYSDDMKDAVDRLTKGQNDALKLTDGTQRQAELNRLQSVYTNDSVHIAQALAYKTQQAWTDYQNKQSLCGGTSSGATLYHTAAYPYGYSYSYGYGSYPSYGYFYPYGYSSWYGNYRSAYPYPYTYGYGNSYQYNHGYWPYGGSAYCPQIVLTQAPSGCGYECRYDQNGCQTCEVTCHRGSGNNCLCPQYYSPVCGRDGRTYDSPCQAACGDTAIAHFGQC